MGMSLPIITVVTRETRLEGLKARWATAKAAAFRLQQAVEHEVEFRRKRSAKSGKDEDAVVSSMLLDAAGALAEEDEYEAEDAIYQQVISQLLKELDFGFPLKRIDRSFLPTFDFARCVAVVVIGQDGLVANTAKYVGNLPIIAVNPDPQRNDGILLPFRLNEARSIVRQILNKQRVKTRSITLAEVNLNDGQKMLAFNEFFVGCSSHVSARYTIEAGLKSESQSSSGVIVSTGAGSTGWLSSLFNMTEGLCHFGGIESPKKISMGWEDPRLIWAVREPFASKHSQASLIADYLGQGDELVIGSQMPTNGVIFSDGVESDFLEFSSGTIARFTASEQKARLVVG